MPPPCPFSDPARTHWSPWIGFAAAKSAAPAEPGLYRFRRPRSPIVEYIGDTGTGKSTIAKRIDVLRTIEGREMPYRWPYSAAPALWALRDEAGAELDVSWLALPAKAGNPTARWYVEVALHRAAHGTSPAVNFGRMPIGYRSSSSYNCDLMHSGGLYRGGRTRTKDDTHVPGRAPFGPLDGDPTAASWCGLPWSGWSSSGAAAGTGHLHGFVRVRAAGADALLDVAYGKLEACAARLRKRATSKRLEYSHLAAPEWPAHQHEEIFVDLLGAYVLFYGGLPGR